MNGSTRPLRVLSVVTLVTPSGEYGGPVTVALNQSAALRAQGHDVVLAGAERGWDRSAPGELGGTPARLFTARDLVPGAGFAGVGAPGLWRWVARHVNDFDVAHVHLARDLVTLPVARIAQQRKVPTVLQTHGMIDPSVNPLAPWVDRALTRPVLRRAARVLCLTEHERSLVTRVEPSLATTTLLVNGVPAAPAAPRTSPPVVLFLARLAPRKRPADFVEAARVVGPEVPGARFLLVGPDEGEGSRIAAAVERARAEGVDVAWTGPIPPVEVRDRLSTATVYVLPAVDEPYPMTVLEAMSVGVPVVVTNSCGLAPAVAEAGAGVVISPGVDGIVGALRELLGDADGAYARGRAGRELVSRQMNMDAVTASLVACYRDVVPA